MSSTEQDKTKISEIGALAVQSIYKSDYHRAAANGNVELCASYVENQGLPVDIPDDENRTALLCAAVNNQLRTVQYLLSQNADPNYVAGPEGTPLLHWIVAFARVNPELDYTEVVRTLLRHGADPALTTENGVTAETLAPLYLVDLLGSHNPDIIPAPLSNDGEVLDLINTLDDAESNASVLDAYETAAAADTDGDDDTSAIDSVSYAAEHRYTYSDVGDMLTSLIKDDVLHALNQSGKPFCLLVRCDWVIDFENALLGALSQCVAVGTETPTTEEALYSKLSGANINPEKLPVLVMERRRSILGALARGDIVICTASTIQKIDRAIMEFVTLELTIPKFNKDRLLTACKTFFNNDVSWDIPDEDWIRLVTPQDFFIVGATVGTQVDSASILKQLRRQVDLRVRAHSPRRAALKLDALHGMPAAKTWARNLANDIRAAVSGELPWTQVDRGALLEGPPGVGKTALARAIAAEIGIPVIATTASTWHGAGYLQDMLTAMEKDFARAAELSPAILFIDELDAIGNRSIPGQHEQWVTWSVNHLLALIDGFNSNQQVIVLGATNYADKIDPALRRSGRLDRTIPIPLPNKQALTAIYTHYIGVDNHTLTGDDIDALAASSIGTTGADVERYIREARRMARAANRPLIKQDVLKAVYATPPEDQRQPMTAQALKEVAYHEAGHALLMWLDTDKGEQVRYLSIVPRTDGTLGFVAQSPNETRQTLSSHAGKSRLATYLAGRAAEELVFGRENVSSGSSSDLRAATATAAYLVNRCGLGPQGWLSVTDRPDARREKQIEQLLQEAYTHAKEQLQAHRSLLDIVAETLLEKTELSGADFMALVRQYEHKQGGKKTGPR